MYVGTAREGRIGDAKSASEVLDVQRHDVVQPTSAVSVDASEYEDVLDSSRYTGGRGKSQHDTCSLHSTICHGMLDRDGHYSSPFRKQEAEPLSVVAMESDIASAWTSQLRSGC